MLQKKIVLTAFFFFLKLFCFGQTINVLKLKKKKFYSEQNQVLIDSSFKIINSVKYDMPFSVDEEYNLTLILDIIDTTNFKLKKILNLPTDTSLIKCKFINSSSWGWKIEKNNISGNIFIISWVNNKIELEYNLNVLLNKTGESYIYKGKRNYLIK